MNSFNIFNISIVYNQLFNMLSYYCYKDRKKNVYVRTKKDNKNI